MKNTLKKLVLTLFKSPIGNNSITVFVIFFLAISSAAMSEEYEDICPGLVDEGPEDTSSPDNVVGSGTSASCTSAAFVQAVAKGGVITFNCGPEPVTITLTETAKIVNDTGPQIVIDGGDMVTLSGGGAERILYMNTCDKDQGWTTEHCDNQDHPQLTIQNLTFTRGYSDGLTYNNSGDVSYGGGAAVWVRGGRFKIVNCRFTQNSCDETGPDVGGAAVRVSSQYSNLPVYVVNSVFGGSEEDGNSCSNGGGLSSIGVSWTVINSLFSHNKATGNGGNPAEDNTPGGGSGAAIYNDGNTMVLTICDSAIHDNQANEYGGSIFFVSNDHTGTINIENSGLWNNETPGGWTINGNEGGISGHNDTLINGEYISSAGTLSKSITVDVNSDQKIGLAEIIHDLTTLAGGQTPETTMYGRKMGDITYDHVLDLTDVITGLQLLSGEDE